MHCRRLIGAVLLAAAISGCAGTPAARPHHRAIRNSLPAPGPHEAPPAQEPAAATASETAPAAAEEDTAKPPKAEPALYDPF